MEGTPYWGVLPGRDEIIRLLKAEVPGLVAVYVFGSRARGDQHAASDLDLAALAARPLEPVRRWELQEKLAGSVHMPVDLVDLRAASTVMRARVFESAELLWESDRTARQAFEAVALGAYARLNEERRGILDDVRQRGSVHG